MRKPTLLLAGLLFLLGLSAPSLAQQDKTYTPPVSPQKSALAAQDQTFVNKAAIGGAYGLDLGRMGVEKSVNPEVKSFATAMVTENETMNDSLAAVADRKNISSVKPLGKKQTKELKRLSQLSGRQFDEQFISTALKEHRNTLKAFEKEAKSGKDPDLRKLATETIPTLQRHIQMAERVQQKLRR